MVKENFICHILRKGNGESINFSEKAERCMNDNTYNISCYPWLHSRSIWRRMNALNFTADKQNPIQLMNFLKNFILKDIFDDTVAFLCFNIKDHLNLIYVFEISYGKAIN